MSPGAGPPVRYEKRGPVATVTIDRPEVLNALSLAVHEQLGRAWDEAEADGEVRVVVLTGSGERAFSSGQDLKELSARLDTGVPATGYGSRDLPGWPRLTERFDFSKPVVARVNGLALGGGFELVLACDLAIAADHAEFGLPEARLGLVPGAGGVFRLVQQMPYRLALGHLLTGRRIAAPRALELGLVNDVVPAAELDARVDEWVDDLLAAAPLAVRSIRQAARAAATMPVERAFATRFPAEELRMASTDAAEGARAFVERRLPRWSGR